MKVGEKKSFNKETKRFQGMEDFLVKFRKIKFTIMKFKVDKR